MAVAAKTIACPEAGQVRLEGHRFAARIRAGPRALDRGKRPIAYGPFGTGRRPKALHGLDNPAVVRYGDALTGLQNKEIIVPLGCQQLPDELRVALQLFEAPVVLAGVLGGLLLTRQGTAPEPAHGE